MAARKPRTKRLGPQADESGRWQTQYVRQLLRPAMTNPAGPAPATAEVPVARMQQQLGSVVDVVNHCTSSTTLHRRHNIWGELEAFLAMEGRSADEAIPEDICRFIDSYYQHEHSGTMLPDGSAIAAPHSLQNARSLLSGIYRQQGHSRPWSDADASGNPCDSMLVSQYLSGYKNMQTLAGYAEQCAVPFSAADLKQALQAVARASMCTEQVSVRRWKLVRQGAELILGFSTALRGHDLAKLQLADLTATDGQPLVQQLAPALLLHAGDTSSVWPYFVENRRQANAGTIQVTVPEDDLLNPALWLHLLFSASSDCCMPLREFLFRPTNPCCIALHGDSSQQQLH